MTLSNKTIVMLLSIALVLAITSTTVNMVRLNMLGIDHITGVATSTTTGETNLTILAVTSISTTFNTLSFGSGRVNASCDFCIMDSNTTVISMYSNGSNFTAPQCCVNFNTSANAGFLIENTGNVNISIGYTCSGNCTFPAFIGGTRLLGMGGLELKVTPNSVTVQSGEQGSTDTASSCLGGGGLNITGWNITNGSGGYGMGPPNGTGVGQNTYVMISAAGHWLCGNQSHYPLDSGNTKDAAVVDINVTVPADAPATGIKSSFVLTFNATSAG